MNVKKHGPPGHAEEEFSGLERFSHLEDNIHHVVDAYRTLRLQAEQLQKEVVGCKADIERLKKAHAEEIQQSSRLQQERNKIKHRVRNLINLIASMEPKGVD